MRIMTLPDPKANERPTNRYLVRIRGLDAAKDGCVFSDVYDVLVAFNVACPAVAHAVKKLLMAGQRGHKDRLTDLQEAAVALTRAVELEGEGSK